MSRILKWLFLTILSIFIIAFGGEDLSIEIFCSRIVSEKSKGKMRGSVVQHKHAGRVQVNVGEKISNDITKSPRSEGYVFSLKATIEYLG